MNKHTCSNTAGVSLHSSHSSKLERTFTAKSQLAGIVELKQLQLPGKFLGIHYNIAIVLIWNYTVYIAGCWGGFIV